MDIETFSTDELMDELAKRFEATVIATMRESESKNAMASDECMVQYFGSTVTCYGLVCRAKLVVEKNLEDVC